jgi:hypothetical protein
MKLVEACHVQYLAPPGSSKTNSENGEQPRVRLAKVCQGQQHSCPDTNEEGDNQKKNLPLGYGHVPKEAPVTAVRLESQVNKAYYGRYSSRLTPLSQ